MPTSGRPWQKLNALADAIDASELREPYPRLAQLMQALATQQGGIHAVGARPSYS